LSSDVSRRVVSVAARYAAVPSTPSARSSPTVDGGTHAGTGTSSAFAVDEPTYMPALSAEAKAKAVGCSPSISGSTPVLRATLSLLLPRNVHLRDFQHVSHPTFNTPPLKRHAAMASTREKTTSWDPSPSSGRTCIGAESAGGKSGGGGGDGGDGGEGGKGGEKGGGSGH